MSRPESGPRGALGRLSAVLLSLGLAAPASAQLAVSERGGPIRFQVGEESLTVSLSRDVVRGGGFDLRRTGSSLKGRLRGGDVDLRWPQGPIVGRVGVEDSRLELSRMASEQGLRVDGELAHWPTSLVISPVGISGDVGGCSYTLTVAGGHYTGWRTCQPDVDGEPTSVSLSLPKTMEVLGEKEQAALLSLLLSAQGLPPAPPREASDSGRTLEGPGLDEGPRR
ncbi:MULTISPECIES: hypothetical protein [Myxococcus]|uniref:Uncharacterized protein n=1 Tax=Myxococcus llanfairpwllgwyngyllgogerychwyrndrobwllllantysiliogogogochensis TaxID=2590453 RepID=A0A540X0H4_9BACT|nr:MULTISPECIES: hypothetical protein [Myxococcus]NTX06374.1 hypothetical protein [Myxococcus sp. CA040A]NTX09632.1 hypothetical protein [Myxococcus sp. CA056]NTX34996.1 hypothetical protein [Myxococcus sp. CA033]NTX58136.1 hypothetical protein [Myxococcus sp. CA039A]TQF14710.1 hypothetical protein FJV41_17450 [Myxococcus llanfairpwllgwyngyllgogerychwyrndrobwllllantysiliogogogochensis]